MKRPPIIHLGCSSKDIASEQQGGRFFFLPGSRERANVIADRFERKRTFLSERGLDVHVGILRSGQRKLDVGCVSTGMGCPSLGIVVNELFAMDIRRFLRVGTAGSLAPDRVKGGDVVVCTGAVRDEGTSNAYAPLSVPALASAPMVNALVRAACSVVGHYKAHVGLVHTKDSLHGREFGVGPKKPENMRYMKVLRDLGVLATEMETSHLFVLGQLYSAKAVGVITRRKLLWNEVQVGCILAVIGDDEPFGSADLKGVAQERAIQIATESVWWLNH